LTDEGILQLAEPLKKLKDLKDFYINFTECEKLTDNSIPKLLEAIKERELEKISIVLEKCGGLSIKAINSVFELIQK